MMLYPFTDSNQNLIDNAYFMKDNNSSVLDLYHDVLINNLKVNDICNIMGKKQIIVSINEPNNDVMFKELNTSSYGITSKSNRCSKLFQR